MLRLRHLESLDLPELAPYHSMKWQLEHRRAGIFVAEGEKVVRRLLDSQFEVISVLLPEKWLPDYAPLVDVRPEVVDVFIAPKEELERLTGYSMYQGVLALARIPRHNPLAALLELRPRPHLFVAAEGICNAENVGVLIRNAAALGAQGLVAGETCASPFLRRAVRSSMGTIFKLPIVEAPNLKNALLILREAGIRVIAAHPSAPGRKVSETDFRGDCCVVLGNEGAGMSADILAVCDDQVAIPMHSDVDSLNVASASAIFLYEVCRQRGHA